MPQPSSSPTGAALRITKYCTRPFAGNAIHAPVHVFAARHDPRRLDPNAKRHLTTTLYPSLSKPGVDGNEHFFYCHNNTKWYFKVPAP